MEDVFCCCCGEAINDDIHARLLEVDYCPPEDEPLTIHAICCGGCALEYDDPIRRQVIEMVISSKLIRVRLPDKEFTPEG